MHTLRIVLLPGMDGTGLLFEPFCNALPNWVQPIVVRYPNDHALSYPELLTRVRAQLPTEDFVILGESFSGPLALMAAALAPRGLQAVVLCASFVTSPVRVASFLQSLVQPALFRAAPLAWQARLMLGAAATPQLLGLVTRALAQPRGEVMAERARAILELDASDALRACRVPLLYLLAKSDRLVAARNAAYIAELKPDTTICRLPGPHLLLQASPIASWHAVRDFVGTPGM